MDDLLRFDQQFFYLINGKWHNAFLDSVLPVIRTSQLWVPLYLFLLVFMLVNFGTRAIWWIVFVALTAVLSDFISSDIIKANFFRLRPCNDPDLIPQARTLLGYRPKSSSFTSSHATNHFTLATFFYFTLKQYIGAWGWLFFVWASIIIYSQVYVGVHYPLDVLAGAAVGMALGYLSARSYNKQYKLA
jgi:undecaprenyl-diphosphatase